MLTLLVLRALENPAPEELAGVIGLYRAEGWWGDGPDDPAVMRRMIAGSLIFLVVEEGGRIVGMGRAIGDGVSDAYIQDVAVAKAFRGRGLGSAIIRELASRLRSRGIGWVGLVAEPGTRAFYERLGFAAMEGSVPMKRP